MGCRSHCRGGTGVGGVLHLLRFKKMLREKEKAQESEREKSSSQKNGKGG